jgi:predicted ATPase
MERPHVDWIRVENFRCIKHAELRLTPLHALIGPNDSGKSSLLHAIKNAQNTRFWITALGTGFSTQFGVFGNVYPSVEGGHGVHAETADQTLALVQRRPLLRLDPDELRRPTALIPQRTELWFANEKGEGLASLYDALLSRDRDAFTAIDVRFRNLFPTVKALRLENANYQTKTMGLSLHSGVEVGPGEMSEGMLYWLAFAIVQHLQPQGILLIEEPENGLHPARIAEVVRILRDISKSTQVLLATHSPLVINELKPEEVTVVTRSQAEGTRCTPMRDTKNFEKRSQVYALGELWLSYADGDFEKELVEKPASEASKAV